MTACGVPQPQLSGRRLSVELSTIWQAALAVLHVSGKDLRMDAAESAATGRVSARVLMMTTDEIEAQGRHDAWPTKEPAAQALAPASF
jgi:hypothetical protein